MTADRKRRPRGVDFDIFGLTHKGRVREENQDQFLIASLHKRMNVWHSSLSVADMAIESPWIAGLLVVADGVGGIAGGQQASGTAVQALARYVTHTMNCYYDFDVTREADFLHELRASVERCHAIVRAEQQHDPERQGMATTLTLVQVLWPHAYVVQVGDTRLYIMRDESLVQVTRDQTVAQELIDRGIPKSEVEGTRYDHILSSAIGADLNPVTVRVDLEWNDVLLLCSDGLNKHVTDAEIQRVLESDVSAESACRRLVDRALEGGGTDNVTVVVARIKADAGRNEPTNRVAST